MIHMDSNSDKKDTSFLPWKAFVFKSYNPVKYLSPDGKDQVKSNFIYKYLSEKGFKGTILNGIRFVEPSKWNDKFENRFYTADYKNLNPTFNTKAFAACFTAVKHNEAAWKAYIDPTSFKTPAEQLCFRLKINRRRLKLALRNVKDFTFYEAPITYLSEHTIKNMHIPGIPGAIRIHNAFFQNPPFELDKYLSLLTIKREHFSYEHEIRYFAVPNPHNAETNINTEIFIGNGILDIVDEIFVARPYGAFKLSNEELEQVARQYNIKDRYKLVSGDIYEDNTELPITIVP